MNIYRNILFLLATASLSGCSVVADIFKAGMSVGAIAVIVVIVVIIGLVIKMMSGRGK